jgi:hypothetical protein
MIDVDDYRHLVWSPILILLLLNIPYLPVHVVLIPLLVNKLQFSSTCTAMSVVTPHISTPSKVLPIGISIPPQWLTNITVVSTLFSCCSCFNLRAVSRPQVSRRHYKQRVRIQVQRHGSVPSSAHHFESGSDETRKTMKDILNHLETLALVPEEHNMEISLTFAYQSGETEAQSKSCKVLEVFLFFLTHQ